VRPGGWSLPKPDAPHLRNIGVFDHASVRVRAKDRDDAIVEFLELTNYSFSMAVYVDNLNSITNVARLPGEPYAMVITSGLGEAAAGQEGPTEKFIQNYGRRIHHLAFRTKNIEDTFAGLKAQGMEFLLELVGSPGEGLMQTFSRPSPHTLIVNEYIHRYEGFDGFFTKSNVTLLTEATARQ
jgi:4-hydroxyphenylpyruvate dioxygenase-like putative hemolysin